MINKLRKSERKISDLLYDIIPTLYWNDKGNQINIDWYIGSSAICQRIIGDWFPTFRVKMLVTAMRRHTTEESIPHPRRCLDLNTRKDIIVKTVRMVPCERTALTAP